MDSNEDQAIDPRIPLMRLVPYRAISREMRVVGGPDGIEYACMPLTEFHRLIRHFLKFLPLSDELYLQSSADLAEAINTGQYRGIPSSHFIEFGYFEGRRPLPEYLPEDYGLRSATEDHPNSYWMAVLEGMQALSEHSYAKAISHLQRAVDSSPGSVRVRTALSRLLLDTCRPFQALSTLRQVAPADVESPEIASLMAVIAQAVWMPDSRAIYLQRAVDISHGGAPDLRASLGEALLDVGRFDSAKRIFATLGPEVLGGDSFATKARAEKLLAQVRGRAALLARTRRSRALTPEEWSELCHLLACCGRTRCAALLWRELERLLAGGRIQLTPDGWVSLAEAARISSGLDAAISILNSARRAGISNTKLVEHLAALSYRAGDTDEAAFGHLKDPTQRPTEQRYQYLVISAIQARYFDAARAHAAAWMKNFPHSTRWAILGLVLLAEMGRLKHTEISGLLASGEADVRSDLGLVPRVIAQFWNDRAPPEDVAKAMKTWAANNSGFIYRIYNEISARGFLKENHNQEVVDAYDVCRHPAMKADFFRLAYLAVSGGIFVDADEACVISLDKVLSSAPGRSLVLFQSSRGALLASPIACAPRNHLVTEMLMTATRQLLKSAAEGIRVDSWQATGPGVITRVVANHLLGDDERQVSQVHSEVAIFCEPDRDRVVREGTFDYKMDPSRNWRTA